MGLKEKLTAPRASTPSGFPEDDVDVPGVGTVRVRGLSRFEVAVLKKAGMDESTIDGTQAMALERKYLSAAMVDPPMSEAEVGAWQKVAGVNELDVVLTKVQELSAQQEGADKEAFQGNGRRPGPGGGVLPGGAAADAGVPATADA